MSKSGLTTDPYALAAEGTPRIVTPPHAQELPNTADSDTMTIMTMKTTIRRAKGAGETWPVAEAKARLSELIDHALADGPQVITRKGREAVVVVSAEEWDRKTKRSGNLAEFFAASPLRGADVRIERTTDAPRPIEL